MKTRSDQAQKHIYNCFEFTENSAEKSSSKFRTEKSFYSVTVFADVTNIDFFFLLVKVNSG